MEGFKCRSSVPCHLGYCVVWEWIVVGLKMEARSILSDFSCPGIRWQDTSLDQDDGSVYEEKWLDLAVFWK